MRILETGFDLNIFNGIELLTAIQYGLTDVAKLLITNGIDMNSYSPKVNRLFSAVKYENLDVVLALLLNQNRYFIQKKHKFIKVKQYQ